MKVTLAGTPALTWAFPVPQLACAIARSGQEVLVLVILNTSPGIYISEELYK